MTAFDKRKQLDRDFPAKFIKCWSEDPMRSRAVVEISGRTFFLYLTGYKGPTEFIRVHENGKELHHLASKKSFMAVAKIQGMIEKESRALTTTLEGQ